MDLLINTYGTRIRSAGERITLNFPANSKKKKQEYTARRIEKIIILRPSSISTGAVQLAINHNIDIVYLGSFGKPVGRIFPSNPKGITHLRRAQLAAASSPLAFTIAQQIVRTKTQNQIDYLKNLSTQRKKNLSLEIAQAQSLHKSLDIIFDSPKGREQLFGIEGFIADRYFAALKKLYRFPNRKPRGRDKFNSALNYGYGILYNEVERACLYIGLDPYLGFFHSERYGKPSLILDLVEEFRVPIIDSTIFPLFLDKKLSDSKNFKKLAANQYQLSPLGKSQIVSAVYSRLNQLTLWDNKTQAVKKIIEYQIRNLSHVLLGKKNSYHPFTYSALTESNE